MQLTYFTLDPSRCEAAMLREASEFRVHGCERHSKKCWVFGTRDGAFGGQRNRGLGVPACGRSWFARMLSGFPREANKPQKPSYRQYTTESTHFPVTCHDHSNWASRERDW